MRPLLPPQLGLVLLAFCTLVALALFGSMYATSAAQAQHASQVFDPLVTTDASADTQVALADLVIGIQHSTPTIVNQTITFSATLNITDATGLSFRWQFGDSQAANGRGVQHIYQTTGDFLVRLFVTSATEQKEAEKWIKVKLPDVIEQPAPSGLAIDVLGDDPNRLEAQKSINFLASVAKGSNVRYTWDFDDGSPRVTGSAVTHSFDQPRNYTIRVEAVNDVGHTTTSRTIKINNAPPIGLIFRYAPKPATVGEIITFTADQTRGTNLRYEWQITDGSLPQSGQLIRYPFRKAGRYEVRVIARNDAGEAEYSESVTIRPGSPRLNSVIENSPKNPGEPVTFFVSASSEAPIYLYYEWGDRGRLTKALAEPADTLYRDEQPHAYPEAGKYPVAITAYNEFGAEQKAMIAYIGVDRPLQTTIQHTYPEIVLPNQAFRFQIVENIGTMTCRWIFFNPRARTGEGRITTLPGVEVEHTFAQSGAHVVTIECRTADGTIAKVFDFVLMVRTTMFFPLISADSRTIEGDTRLPTATATNTPVPPTNTVAATETPTPIPSATQTATTVPPTGTATLPATPTATPTFIATAPTATPTATAPFGGTIPQR